MMTTTTLNTNSYPFTSEGVQYSEIRSLKRNDSFDIRRISYSFEIDMHYDYDQIPLAVKVGNSKIIKGKCVSSSKLSDGSFVAKVMYTIPILDIPIHWCFDDGILFSISPSSMQLFHLCTEEVLETGYFDDECDEIRTENLCIILHQIFKTEDPENAFAYETLQKFVDKTGYKISIYPKS